MTTVPIRGRTYPVRDKLRQLGGRWYPDLQAWLVPADRADEARAIVASASAAPSDRPRRWPLARRLLQPGEEIIDRPSRGPDDPGYMVGQTYRFGRVWGGGGDGYHWTIVEAWTERYDDTAHHWAIMRPATADEAAMVASAKGEGHGCRRD
jgi:hypothetical protein